MVDCPVPSDGADEWLEPDAGRLARPVLRGRWRSNALLLPDIGVDADSGLVPGDSASTWFSNSRISQRKGVIQVADGNGRRAVQ